MRPRVFPAEDAQRVTVSCWRLVSFNEAAGIPRGRLTGGEPLDRDLQKRFNEAAGIPRGRPPLVVGPESIASCFNEAAGIPRGRREGSRLHGLPWAPLQ